MTLLEIAEHLSITQQRLYDEYGRCVLRKINQYDESYPAIVQIHIFKGIEENSFYIQKPDDNVTFILLVHEATK